jgi:hypothetical protein
VAQEGDVEHDEVVVDELEDKVLEDQVVVKD